MSAMIDFDKLDTTEVKQAVENAQYLVDNTGKPYGIYSKRGMLLVLPLNRDGLCDPSLLECITPVTHSPRSDKV